MQLNNAPTRTTTRVSPTLITNFTVGTARREAEPLFETLEQAIVGLSYDVGIPDGLDEPASLAVYRPPVLRMVRALTGSNYVYRNSGHTVMWRGDNPRGWAGNQSHLQSSVTRYREGNQQAIDDLRRAEFFLHRGYEASEDDDFNYIRSRSIRTSPYLVPGAPTRGSHMAASSNVTWALNAHVHIRGAAMQGGPLAANPRGTLEGWAANHASWRSNLPDTPLAEPLFRSVAITLPSDPAEEARFQALYGTENTTPFWFFENGKWLQFIGKVTGDTKFFEATPFPPSGDSSTRKFQISKCVLASPDSTFRAGQHSENQKILGKQWVRDMDVFSREEHVVKITSMVIGSASIPHDAESDSPDMKLGVSPNATIVCEFIYELGNQAWKYVIGGVLNMNVLKVNKVITVIALSGIIPSIKSGHNIHIKDDLGVHIIPAKYEPRRQTSSDPEPEFERLEIALSDSARRGRGWLGMIVDDGPPEELPNVDGLSALQRTSVDFEEITQSVTSLSQHTVFKEACNMLRRVCSAARGKKNGEIKSYIDSKLCVFIGAQGVVYVPVSMKEELTRYDSSFQDYPYYFTAEKVLRKLYYARTTYVVENKDSNQTPTGSRTRCFTSKIHRDAFQTPVSLTKHHGYLVYTASPAAVTLLTGTFIGNDRQQSRGQTRATLPELLGSVYSYPTRPSKGDHRTQTSESEFVDALGQRFTLGNMAHDMAHLCHRRFTESPSLPDTSIIWCPSFALLMVRKRKGTKLSYTAQVIISPRTSRLVMGDGNVNVSSVTSSGIARHSAAYISHAMYITPFVAFATKVGLSASI